ncbi:glutathione S-transferase-like protein [Trichophyton mentagrophytes]|uniref:Glutathione S-transferase n=3 Tax=Trichophyton TaxID=5550 RepID=A0A059J7G1_TRIIM|nr:glutathione transferase [Trichophyton tonsurans CBS 112818]EGE01400.1 glutathione S-transferase II [Trichophyton equinum CBS 127.97]EZF31895.1 hypothetical protein H101_04506 [Trichophyton interdigitale H6]KDB23623.1 hypothetical protein H109_04513 [Trichophyton interdigitale MR816]GBF61037.1 glutathione S-transferase-like protein [Trichophyton mentagrophytes]
MAPRDIKPLVLYGIYPTANPVKVAIILEILNIPYELKSTDFRQCKEPEYLAINPNGRCPAIHDPNTGIYLWESGAIVEYLVDEYDKENAISFSSLHEKYHLRQWLHFQVSGQGPYIGQFSWFKWYHVEKFPSAVDRYAKETRRVMGVVDLGLKDKEWLVGGKMTYADICLVPWFFWAKRIGGDEWYAEQVSELPNFQKWWNKIIEVPKIKEFCAGIAQFDPSYVPKDVLDRLNNKTA